MIVSCAVFRLGAVLRRVGYGARAGRGFLRRKSNSKRISTG
jgi:hypothetical protein